MNKLEFRHLHDQNKPLLLANVWDAASARLSEELGFQALGTSSAAIASMLGFQDGEKLSFDDLLFMVDKIIRSVNIPLSVDMESGYGKNAGEITDNLKKLYDLGVVGVNLEDSKVDDTRYLLHTEEFSALLNDLKAELMRCRVELFINVRTDTFLLKTPEPLKETLNRIEAYEFAGADGFFIPGVVGTSDIKAITSSTNKPINVMAMPDLPTFETLTDLGVKRISMGNFVHEASLAFQKKTLDLLLKQQSFDPLFSK